MGKPVVNPQTKWSRSTKTYLDIVCINWHQNTSDNIVSIMSEIY